MGFSFMALVFIFLFSSCSAQPNSPYVLSPVELDAMFQICANWKNQPHQTWKGDISTWCGPNEKPCNPTNPWFGVRCLQKQWTNDTTRWNVYIVQLVIEDPNLIGTLLPSFGNFTNLASLTIEGAQNLTGPLPDLTKLRSLNSIKLGGNSLNGSIPISIASSPVLQYLDLSRNRFTGGIPGDLLSKTMGLQTLNVSQNLLYGVLNETLFQNQSSLIELDLSKNQFNGYFPYLSSSLYYLDASDNNFEGSFPNMTMLQNLQYLNLRHNRFIGEVHESMLFNMTLLETLDISNNGFFGPIPNLSSLVNLKTLNLSHNNFHSEVFPNWIMQLTHLETLSLDNTSIYGFLDLSRLFSNTSALKSLSIQDNNISDVIYINSIKNLDKVNINLQRNPFCTTSTSKIDLQRCVCEQKCYDSGRSSNNKMKIIMTVTTVSGLLFILIIIVSTLLLRKISKKKYELILEAQKKFLEYEVKPTVFTYNELRIATKDFHPSMKLGEGGYGIVYKGFLSNGDEVAIKKLSNTIAQKDTDDFLNEVVLVTAIKHRNLVSLKGCCLKRKQRILVYEYVENYDLAQVLFEHKGNHNIHWQKRLQICLDVANGLHYLHALAEPRIIHRDVKANNILLDRNLRAKIADFGLALFFPIEQSDILTMHVAGTRGYLAPEYATLGQLSEKVDVYSFGILVLEIISGRRIIDLTLLPHKAYLFEWVQNLYDNGNIIDIVDPLLHLNVQEEVEVERVIKIALCCSQLEAEKRPTMARVVAMLQGDMDLEIAMSKKQLSNNRFIELIPQGQLDNNHLKVNSIDMHEESTCRPMLLGSSSSSNYNPYTSSNSSTLPYIQLSEVKLR